MNLCTPLGVYTPSIHDSLLSPPSLSTVKLGKEDFFLQF